MKKTWKIAIGSFLSLALASSVQAGNVKKVYVNVAKEGQAAQASDIPANYGQVDTKLKTVAYDLAGGRLGTLNSTVVTNEGLQFNGTNGVKLTNDTGFNEITELTLELWIKAPTTMGQMYRGVIGKQQASPYDRDYNFYVRSMNSPYTKIDALHFSSHHFGSSAYILPQPFEPGSWHHIALTVDKTGLAKYYADGEKFAQYQGTPSKASDPYDVYLGQTDNVFNGVMKEVRIWNVARSEDQIEDNMEELHDFNKNLIAYFKFVN